MKKANKTNKNNRGRQIGDTPLPNPQTSLVLRDACPDRLRVPLTYHHNLVLSGAVSAEQIFNLNSLFDPDRTGVGHQPLGFDQWTTFYNRYRVDKVDVSIDFVNNSATSASSLLCIANNDAAAINTQATLSSAIESPYSWSDLIATSGGNNIAKFRRTFYLNSVTGVSRQKYESDDSYQAVMTASPTESILLHVVAQDIGFATNVTVLGRVRMTFYASLYDRNQLTQS